MQLADAVSMTVVGPEDVPEPTLVGVNAPDREERSWPVREEAIRRDAKREGLIVAKLLGRVTVLNEQGRTYCFRICHGSAKRTAKRRGESPLKYRCGRVAGEGTFHQGAGACRYHGGNQYGNSPQRGSTHGAPNLRYDVARALLGQDAEGDFEIFREMNLVQELALQRQMLNAYLGDECFDVDGRLVAYIPADVIENTIEWAEKIVRTVERAKRIENSSALTRAHIIYLIQTLTRLGREFVPVDKLEEYGAALLSAFGLEVGGLESWVEPDDEPLALGIGAVVESG